MIRRIIKRFFNTVNPQQEKNADTLPYLQMHASSFIAPKNPLDFRIGRENRTYVTIGEHCIINGTFTFESLKGEVLIGNNVHLGGVHFISRSKIIIGDDVTMAWGITIYDHNSHSIHWKERQHDNQQCYADYVQHDGNNIVNKNWDVVVSKPIIIESKVWIGFNVTILKGVTIGEGAVVGACSVVTKDVEPWTVVGGNPAQIVKRLR